MLAIVILSTDWSLIWIVVSLNYELLLVVFNFSIDSFIFSREPFVMKGYIFPLFKWSSISSFILFKRFVLMFDSFTKIGTLPIRMMSPTRIIAPYFTVFYLCF
jgi:hypothetical protein